MIQALGPTGVMISNFFCLKDEQVDRLKPFNPRRYSKSGADDQRFLTGLLFVSRNWLR